MSLPGKSSHYFCVQWGEPDIKRRSGLLEFISSSASFSRWLSPRSNTYRTKYFSSPWEGNSKTTDPNLFLQRAGNNYKLVIKTNPLFLFFLSFLADANKLPKDKSEPLSFFLIRRLAGEQGCFRKSAMPLLQVILLGLLPIEFCSSQGSS